MFGLLLIYGIPCYGNGIPFRKLSKFPEPKLRNRDTILRNTENDQEITNLRKRNGSFRKLGLLIGKMLFYGNGNVKI